MLLDSHALVWFDQGDRRLHPKAAHEIQQAFASNDVAVSTITFLEIATLIRKGDLSFIPDIEEWRQSLFGDGLRELPVTGWIATQAGLLPDMHGDPIDRIIVATALHGNHELATADRQILAWTGPLRRLPSGR